MCAALLMLSFAAAPLAGCVTDGKGTAPSSECRGREPILLTADQAAILPAAQLRPIVAHNETLERECGVKAPGKGRR